MLKGKNGHNPRLKRKKPRKSNINRLNSLILTMVNRERRKRHLNPVSFDEGLHSHAIRRSKHMANKRELSHSRTILENAAQVWSNGSPIIITKRMYYTWKRSSPHWSWMMNPAIKKAAFAYTKNGKYAYGAYAFK